MVDPIWSVKYIENTSTMPLIQLAILAFFLVFNKSYVFSKVSVVLVFCIAIGVMNGVLMVEQYDGLWLFAPILLSFILVSSARSGNELTRMFNLFTKSMFIVVLAIMIVRLQMYDMNFIRARSGSNIFGANAVISLFFLSYVISGIFNEIKAMHTILFFILIVSIIFISKTGILLGLFLLIVNTYCTKRLSVRYSLKMIVSMVIATIFMVYVVSVTSLGESILLRFNYNIYNDHGFLEALTDFYKVQIESQRGVLFERSFELIREYYIKGIGLGNYYLFSNYSSSHNLFINNIVELGVLVGVIVNLIFLIPFYLIKKVVLNRSKVQVHTAYALFLILANTAGEKMIQPTGYITSFVILMIFGLFQAIKIKYNEEKKNNSIYR